VQLLSCCVTNTPAEHASHADKNARHAAIIATHASRPPGLCLRCMMLKVDITVAIIVVSPLLMFVSKIAALFVTWTRLVQLALALVAGAEAFRPVVAAAAVVYRLVLIIFMDVVRGIRGPGAVKVLPIIAVVVVVTTWRVHRLVWRRHILAHTVSTAATLFDGVEILISCRADAANGGSEGDTQ